jgi:hypothetical protein
LPPAAGLGANAASSIAGTLFLALLVEVGVVVTLLGDHLHRDPEP